MKRSRLHNKPQTSSIKYATHARLKHKKLPKYTFVVVVLALTLGGTYLLLLNLTPRAVPTQYVKSAIDLNVTDDAQDRRNRIQIAKINLEVPFFTGDSPKTLERGAWHRYPERGDPTRGGNFILSAHRFELGSTPRHTKEKSPFYNVHKLSVGDEVKIFFDNHWYTYKIQKIYSVKPSQISIEAPTPVAKLTLYTCSIKGAADGRVVLEATPSLPISTSR